MAAPDQPIAHAPLHGSAEGADGVRHPTRSRRERARTLALLALAVLITVFAVLNLNEVKVDWILGSAKAPLILVIVVSVIVGILICAVAERRRAGRRE